MSYKTAEDSKRISKSFWRRSIICEKNDKANNSTNGYSKKTDEMQSDDEDEEAQKLLSLAPLQEEVNRILAEAGKEQDTLSGYRSETCKCNEKNKVKTLYFSPVRLTSKDAAVNVRRIKTICKSKPIPKRYVWDCDDLSSIQEALNRQRINGTAYE